MADLSLRVLGCGDAFCSGGRLQTCFHLKTREQSLLLDCGTTVLLAMQQQNVDPSSIDRILLSHLHGDHFGGVPFFLLHAQFVANRTKPLTIIGPRGTKDRIEAAIDVLFSDLKDIVWCFPLDVIELEAGRNETVGDLQISSYLVDHPSGAPSLAFRLETQGKILAFSGDTRWTDVLIDIADGADLLIAECHGYRPNGIHHLDWQTLNAYERHLRAKRILLTHMSDSMLSRLPTLQRGRFEFAEDGLATTI
ncbi:MAG: MBL fold metallo-hydrolase [Geminicoccaceae bacterium]